MGKSLKGIGRLSLLMLLAVVCSACTTLLTRIDVPLEPSEGKYEDGVTHYSTILHDLGPPAKISGLPNGMVFLYEYVFINEFQLGIGLGITRELGFTITPESEQFDFRSFFRISYAQAQTERQVLLLTFDDEGILKAQRYLEFGKDLGRGVGLQTIIGISSLVDSDYLQQPATQHDWGMSLLKPLPRTLNENQSLESGNSGLEQRGMPTGAGQHTLEMRE